MRTKSIGPRVSSLTETRRWLMLLLLTIAWGLAALVGLTQWSRLGVGDRVLLLAGAAFVISGWVLSRREIGLWLLAGGPASLVVAAALAGNASTAESATAVGAWIAVSVSMSHVAYTGVLLTRRWVGIVAIVSATLALAGIWAQRPENVVPGPLAVEGGWIAVTAVAAAALALWVAWHDLLDRAEADDAALAALARRTDDELAEQERSRAWRAAAVQVHERLLSTIRYVLQTDHLDRSGLSDFVASTGQEPGTSADAGDEPSIDEATFARLASDVVRLAPSIADLPISDTVRPVLRAAVTECALNAVQHGEATDVEVSARVEGDRVLVDVADNGCGMSEPVTPGLGWSSVLGDSLAAVGGRWSHARVGESTVVTLDVPASHAEAERQRRSGRDEFVQGRILMSYPLIAIAVVGVAFDWFVGEPGALTWILRLLAALATVSAAALVVRRRPVPPRASVPLLLALAAVPWVMAATGPTGAQVPAIAAAANAAGYAIIALGIWSRRWQLPTALVLWAGGVLALVPIGSGTASAPIVVAMVNCLVAVPVTLVVARVGARRSAAAQEAIAAEREAIRREILRANAAASVNQHLASCVTQAERIIEGIAAGSPLDREARHRLACLDGLIRATIQVDPLTGGGMSRAASSLVASAFSRSVPAGVGPLLSSGDPRSLSRGILHAMESAAAGCASIEVRAFTTGDRDYLALELLDPPRPVGPGDFALDEAGLEVVIHEGEAGSQQVMISRIVQAT